MGLNPKYKIAVLPLMIIICLSLVTITAGVLVAQNSISMSGTLIGSAVGAINVELFNDAERTSSCQNIDWGQLEAGTSTTRTIYIRNTGNVSETLSLTTSNWNPQSASSIITLTWNQEGASLGAGQTVPAVLNLTVAQEIGSVTAFGFDLTITGSG